LAWFHQEGVSLFDGKSFMYFTTNDRLPDNQIYSIQEDKNGNPSTTGTLEHVFAIQDDAKGNIWFGNRDTGAWKYDGKTMKNFTKDNQIITSMIWCIYNDNNKLLFGMAGGGVYQFNGKSFSKMF
jgi:hypothetical protein